MNIEFVRQYNKTEYKKSTDFITCNIDFMRQYNLTENKTNTDFITGNIDFIRQYNITKKKMNADFYNWVMKMNAGQTIKEVSVLST